MKVEDPIQNYSTGYIRIYRSLMNKGWYKKSDYVLVWLHLLLKATHKKIEYMFGGKNITLEPGQFISGRKKLADEVGMSENKIHRILEFFEKDEQQIRQLKTPVGRLITILYWDQYQKLDSLLDNEQTTIRQPLDTKQEHKNDKNDKENNPPTPQEEINFIWQEEEFKTIWKEWKQYRKTEFKKTFKTVMSENKAIKHLHNLSGGNLKTAIAIIEQSMGNQWQGLFPLKEPEKVPEKKEYKGGEKLPDGRTALAS